MNKQWNKMQLKRNAMQLFTVTKLCIFRSKDSSTLKTDISFFLFLKWTFHFSLFFCVNNFHCSSSTFPVFRLLLSNFMTLRYACNMTWYNWNTWTLMIFMCSSSWNLLRFSSFYFIILPLFINFYKSIGTYRLVSHESNLNALFH